MGDKFDVVGDYGAKIGEFETSGKTNVGRVIVRDDRGREIARAERQPSAGMQITGGLIVGGIALVIVTLGAALVFALLFLLFRLLLLASRRYPWAAAFISILALLSALVGAFLYFQDVQRIGAAKYVLIVQEKQNAIATSTATRSDFDAAIVERGKFAIGTHDNNNIVTIDSMQVFDHHFEVYTTFSPYDWIDWDLASLDATRSCLHNSRGVILESTRQVVVPDAQSFDGTFHKGVTYSVVTTFPKARLTDTDQFASVLGPQSEYNFQFGCSTRELKLVWLRYGDGKSTLLVEP